MTSYAPPSTRPPPNRAQITAATSGRIGLSDSAIGRAEADTLSVSRLRSEISLRPRNVHQVHASAAAIPPTAPITSDAGLTWSTIEEVRTASTHQVPSARTTSQP